MTATKKEIENYMKTTDKNLKGVEYTGVILGSYTPKDANWSYYIGIVNNKPVIIQFGHIV